jgi:hypothetical protein
MQSTRHQAHCPDSYAIQFHDFARPVLSFVLSHTFISRSSTFISRSSICKWAAGSVVMVRYSLSLSLDYSYQSLSLSLSLSLDYSSFSNDVSKLPAAADGYRLAIHGSLESAGTVLAADSVTVCVSCFKGVRSICRIRSLGHSTTLDTEAAGGLDSDQSSSAFPEGGSVLRPSIRMSIRPVM